MKLVICFKVVLILLTLNILSPGQADDEEEENKPPKSCQKYVYDFLEGVVQAILNCLAGKSTFQPNNIFEYVTRASCLLRCILQEVGVLDLETGLFLEVEGVLYFEETFDTPVKDIAFPNISPCFKLTYDFQPKDYWCKSYAPFVRCVVEVVLKGLIPYAVHCVANPTIGILFSVIKYLAPDSPSLEESADELRRAFGKNLKIKCFDKNCTRQYEFKKVNGSQSIIVYDKDMNIIQVESQKEYRMKQKNLNNNVNKNNSTMNGNNFSNFNTNNVPNSNFYNYNNANYKYSQG